MKLKKVKCEICGFSNPAAINYHHIIPRCDPRCSNKPHNIAVICHVCHDLVHAGEITIIGVYSSTALGGRSLLWFKQGEEPPLEKDLWMVKDNPLVLRKKAQKSPQ